ncbi:MAG: hypothetical protein IJ149_03680 [Oscillospiraceae bacterium]|nr:hypothetical protein [Oscillospiraceae bacterium]
MKYPAKRAAVLLLLPCMMILCGFGEKVELLDQTKLIDLDKAIDAKIGGGSLAETSGEAGEDTSEGGTGTEGSTSASREAVISVRGIYVTYNKTAVDEAELYRQLRESTPERVVLEDDYGEAKLYRRIRRKLREYEDKGLVVTETMT